MDKSSTGTSIDGTMTLFSKLIPPPWGSIKKLVLGSRRLLLDGGSRSILLNILGVTGIGFLPSTSTQVVFLFESNLHMHQETNSLKLKTLGMEPTLTKPIKLSLYSGVKI